AIALSLTSQVLQGDWRHMLDVEKKSDVNIVVERPAGKELERKAAVRKEMGEDLATVTEVEKYQEEEGLEETINVKGLGRKYYGRAGGKGGERKGKRRTGERKTTGSRGMRKGSERKSKGEKRNRKRRWRGERKSRGGRS
ncbi:hypothetical protein NX905_29780, partial [Burkholderia thailandensis]|uniref:hypothetical protein n=1 Tax=Burkholderia thailandensis TaxID=57975 RepID=UPI00217D31D1